jgi:hypothetical protein
MMEERMLSRDGIKMPILVISMFCAMSVQAQSEWPNGPDEDPRLAYPNDPSYIQFNDKGEVIGGKWNLWSFIPDSYTEKTGFRTAEIAMGSGIHADRAWQRTIGDRRTVIAVLDSGIRWDNIDTQFKHYLSKAELKNCLPAPLPGSAADADPYDVDNNGYFNMADYLAADPDYATTLDAAGNGNGIADPEDLILTCSDGVDDDENGFTDDISGWDSFAGDNNPFDDTRFGHGTGEARWSAAAGNDGKGSIGVCPECTILNVRVGDSFVVDANDFATGVIFSVDSGAQVVQEALGSINMTPYAKAAIEYAYDNNTVVIASAADELSFHHNVPGTNNHTVYVHAIVFDGQKASNSTTFLNFNNCTNYGGQLLLSTPGSGCSSEATGVTAGQAGVIYSAAFEAETDPPLSAEELRGILIMSSDDIDVPESLDDSTKFPSGPGWDWHFGYGRNNARTSVDMVLDDEIPPEVDIEEPDWFEPIEVTTRPTVEIKGSIGARVDGLPARYDNYSYTLEWAPGVDPKGEWEVLEAGTGELGGKNAELIHEWDVAAASERYDYSVRLSDPHQYSATLRLTVTTEHNGKTLKNEFRKTVHLLKDPGLMPGFPKNMGTSLEASPKIVDIDADGSEELIFISTDGYVHAMKGDGTEVTGFPVQVGLRDEISDEAFGIADICAFKPEDEKGACSTRGYVDPSTARQWSMMGIAVGRLVEGAGLSIVVPTFDGYVYVYDTEGNLREGWPQRTDPAFSAITSKEATLDEGFFSAPVLYDLDSDGDLEIIGAAMDMHMYVWHHDGTPMDGWPVLVKDPIEEQRARMITTPAVGDIDLDGNPEIVACTNEVFGSNESRGYVLKHTGASTPDSTAAALEDGWPVTTFGLIVNTLPLVGRGCPSNPAIANIDDDPELEINLDAIAFRPLIWNSDGSEYTVIDTFGDELPFDNADIGDKAESMDVPTYTLISNGTFAKFDNNDTVDFIKGTAGFDFALTFAEGGKRAIFDHQLSAWDTTTGKYLTHWPRIAEDWQFFMNPVVVDLDGDESPEVVNGSGGYIVHAWNYRGEEPPGFPKMTGSWIISTPAFGDLDGDDKFEVVAMTRLGWLYAWDTEGPTWGRIEWQTYGHDLHNTNNYEEPVALYNEYPEKPESTDTTDATDANDAVDVTDSADGVDSTDGNDGSDQADGLTGESQNTPVESDSGCSTSQGPKDAMPGTVYLLLGLIFALIVRRTGRFRA